MKYLVVILIFLIGCNSSETIESVDKSNEDTTEHTQDSEKIIENTVENPSEDIDLLEEDDIDLSIINDW